MQLNYVRFLEHPVRRASTAATLTTFGVRFLHHPIRGASTTANLITEHAVRGASTAANLITSASRASSAYSIHCCQLIYVQFLEASDSRSIHVMRGRHSDTGPPGEISRKLLVAKVTVDGHSQLHPNVQLLVNQWIFQSPLAPQLRRNSGRT